MVWNYDFAISAFIMETVILVFYMCGGFLPVKRNQFYLVLLVDEILVVFLDVVTSVMHNTHNEYSTTSLYMATILYFLLFDSANVMYFLYSITLAGIVGKHQKSYMVFAMIPAVIFAFSVLTTGFTGYIFNVSKETGYHMGPGYRFIYLTLCIIIAETIAVAIFNRNSLHREEFYCILFYGACIFVGATMQIIIVGDTLYTNAAKGIGLLVVYLMIQNSDKLRDKKTGLYNSEAFAMFGNEVDSNIGYEFFGIGIDNLSVAKKMYGEDGVNFALKDVGRWLKKNYKGANLYYMHRGRFVIAEKCDLEPDDVRTAIEQRFKRPWNDGSAERIYFTQSITFVPRDIVGIDNKNLIGGILRSLDNAILKGANSFTVVDLDIEDTLKRDAIVEIALNRAIAQNSIEVYFQPIYSSQKKRVCSVEALARLNDKEYGFISPDEFITMAEKNGKIVTLGRQIFEKTCAIMSTYNFEELGIDYVEINLSPVQCMQEGLVDELVSIANKHKVPLYRINLEITETATSDNDILLNIMNQLVDYGVTFSLDDFGTGYSNIVSLLEMPINIVKIDKSILWSYFEGKSNIFPKIADMFMSQGLDLVIEGVETKEMVDKLIEMKCAHLQGFYFSKALPPESFVTYMKNNYPVVSKDRNKIPYMKEKTLLQRVK